LSLDIGDSARKVEVVIADGRCKIALGADESAFVTGSTLEDGPALLQVGQRLRAHGPNSVYFQWAARQVRIWVQDRTTGANLDSVEVRAAGDARFQPRDPVLIDKPWLLPQASEALLLHGATSPFVLGIEPGGKANYWISRPGYVPFRYRFPHGSPRSELVVRLERAAVVHLALDGELPDPEQHRIRLYRKFAGDLPLAPPALVERSLADSLRIDGLPQGSYGVTLEPAIRADPNAALARAVFSAEVGQEQWVELPVGDGFGEAGFARVTVDFPARPTGALRSTARLETQPPRADDRSAAWEHVWESAGSWGPVELLPGEYALLIVPDNASFRVRVRAGEDLRLHVPSYDVEDVLLSIADDETGRMVVPDFVLWSAALDWSGKGGDWPWAKRRNAAVTGGTVAFRAPRTVVQLQISAKGYGHARACVDLSGGTNPCVRLKPMACLELEIVDLDDIPTFPWLSGIRLAQGSRTVAVESAHVEMRDGKPKGQLYFAAAGRIEARFPDLPSSGALLPATFDVPSGGGVPLALDAASLVPSGVR
jgi:hypothetical protein